MSKYVLPVGGKDRMGRGAKLIPVKEDLVHIYFKCMPMGIRLLQYLNSTGCI